MDKSVSRKRDKDNIHKTSRSQYPKSFNDVIQTMIKNSFCFFSFYPKDFTSYQNIRKWRTIRRKWKKSLSRLEMISCGRVSRSPGS